MIKMNDNTLEKSFSGMKTLYEQVAALYTILEYWKYNPFDDDVPIEVDIFRIHEKRYRQIVRKIMNWTYDHTGTLTDIKLVTDKLNIISDYLQLLEDYKRICNFLHLIPLKEIVDQMNTNDIKMEINRLINIYDVDMDFIDDDDDDPWKIYTPPFVKTK